MKDFILVFLFTAGQVQFSAFGPEIIPAQSFQDNEENKAAFVKLLDEQASKQNAKVCAVVPSYDYKSALHKPLYDLLTKRGDDLPGIWEQETGIRQIFSIKPNSVITIEDSIRFCKLAAPVAFKDYVKK